MKSIDSKTFLTITLSKEDAMPWSDFLQRVKKMVESSRIKVVDVRRHGDRLTITYRRLL